MLANAIAALVDARGVIRVPRLRPPPIPDAVARCLDPLEVGGGPGDPTIDDGWGGMLGWFWIACVVTTIVLARVTRAALHERAYSAVMAATGLLYLAIITGFGQDLVARLILAG